MNRNLLKTLCIGVLLTGASASANLAFESTKGAIEWWLPSVSYKNHGFVEKETTAEKWGNIAVASGVSAGLTGLAFWFGRENPNAWGLAGHALMGLFIPRAAAACSTPLRSLVSPAVWLGTLMVLSVANSQNTSLPGVATAS